jgi:DNA invertase Pin-like site-specific DNA recombinase
MSRPVFGVILDRIRSGQSGGFVVYKLDRLARTVLGALTAREELGRDRATLASVNEPQLDYATPAGRAFVQQLFVLAEFTRCTLKGSWAVAQRHAIERGIHISPRTGTSATTRERTAAPSRTMRPHSHARCSNAAPLGSRGARSLACAVRLQEEAPDAHR